MELIGIIIASLVNMFVHSTVAWECSLHTFDILYAFTHDQTLCLVYEDFYLAIGLTFYSTISVIKLKKCGICLAMYTRSLTVCNDSKLICLYLAPLEQNH